jgi:hypothetical protein
MAGENERLLRVSIEDRDYVRDLAKSREESMMETTHWLIDRHRKEAVIVHG